MLDFGWPELIALLTSVGFGVVSAVVPVVNAEAYVIVSQVSAVAGPMPDRGRRRHRADVRQAAAVHGRTPGQGVPVRPASAGEGATRTVSPTRARFRVIMAKLLDLVGQKRWGLPIVLLAAIVGIPPLYAVALLAGATTMRALWFVLVVLVGRVTRFVLLATGLNGLQGWLF